MPDPRVAKLAKVLVHHSIELKPKEKFLLRSSPVAEELNLAVFEEAVKTGAFIHTLQSIPNSESIFYKHASDDQLDYVNPFVIQVYNEFQTMLAIDAKVNTRSLSGIDPARFARVSRANAPYDKIFFERSSRKEMRWCLTVYPTNAGAQEAEMSLFDYQDFVYGACMLNEADPVAWWKKTGVEQKRYADWMTGRDQIVLKGSNVDLKFSVKGRTFISTDGKNNFPDGEIFTGPVEDTAEGWIRFRYPAIEFGQEITDIELWFEKGKVVKEKASKNQELLTSTLNTDDSSRFLGEFGIGTNYGIQRFTKHMLFDEKMGGTIHLAVGSSYPETGGKNVSGIHWDMLCDMNDAEITADGDQFYKDGKITIK